MAGIDRFKEKAKWLQKHGICAAGWLAVLIIYLADVIYIAVNGINVINCDASSEMVLARLLNEEHGLLSTNWYYSSELRVINTQLVFKLGLFLFPHNWHAARTFSVAVFLLILILCGIFLAKAVDLPRLKPWFAFVLIAPFGQWYGWNVIFNSYYVPHIVLAVLILGLMIYVLKSENRSERIVRTILLGLLCLGSGLGGIRQLMITLVPLWGACMILVIFRKFRFDMKILGLSTGMLFLGGIGYIINRKILAYQYSFRNYGETWFAGFDLSRFFNVVGDYISVFGWQSPVKITSLAGLANLCGIAVGLLVMLGGVYALCRTFAEDGSGQDIQIFQLLSAFVVVAFAFLALIYATPNDPDDYNQSYWTVLAPWGLFLLLIVIEKNGKLLRQWILYAFLSVAILLCSFQTMRSPYIWFVPDSRNTLALGEFLNESEWDTGMSSFVSANLITELTDGKIDMWCVLDFTGPTVYEWLQIHRDEQHPEGSFFVVFLKYEQIPIAADEAEINRRLIYQDDRFNVYGFEDGWESYQKFFGL